MVKDEDENRSRQRQVGGTDAIYCEISFTALPTKAQWVQCALLAVNMDLHYWHDLHWQMLFGVKGFFVQFLFVLLWNTKIWRRYFRGSVAVEAPPLLMSSES